MVHHNIDIETRQQRNGLFKLILSVSRTDQIEAHISTELKVIPDLTRDDINRLINGLEMGFLEEHHNNHILNDLDRGE